MGLLDGVTCADVFGMVKSPQPITIDSTNTVSEAIKILVASGVSSAPVWVKADHSFVGFFDSRDVNDLLLKVFLAGEYSDGLSPETELEQLLKHESLGNIPVSMVADHAKAKPFEPVHLSQSAGSLVKALDKVHRLPVTDDNGKFLGIVSQSDIAKYVFTHRQALKDLLRKTLSAVGLDKKPIVTIAADHPVLEALSLMHDRKISSLPLVNEQGEIISVITLSDVKRMFRANDFFVLGKSCVDYISRIRMEQSFEHKGNDSMPYFAVNPETSLEHTLGKLVATRAHRVFVVVDQKPVGVVALTDIIGKMEEYL